MTKVRILVVDDEPVLLAYVRATLESLGFEAQTASNAEEALRLFSNQPSDLVLTDLKMPGMNGAQLATHIKALAPSVPVVLLTGAPPALAVRARSAGVDAILYKPFRPQEMFALLDRLFPVFLATAEKAA